MTESEDSTRTVLFDLDGTLLPAEIDSYMKYYMDAIYRKFEDKIERSIFGKAVMQATYETIDNRDPSVTNLDAFAASFERLTGLPWVPTWEVFNQYYEEEYHELGQYIPQISCAPEVVQRCVDDGWQIILATQPIYPEQAVRVRMAWCGVESMPWHFITTMDKMHYCKPQIDYYREIADLAGLAPARCVMVGNNMQEDMIAKLAGMKTFLVEDHLIKSDGLDFCEPDGRGGLSDVPDGINALIPK